LTFEEPDLEKTPCLGLAMDCARKGGTAPTVMSAANEAAVGLFLARRLSYNAIYDSVAEAVTRISFVEDPSLSDILEADETARDYVLTRV